MANIIGYIFLSCQQRLAVAVFFLLPLLISISFPAFASESVYIEEMTSPEIRERIERMGNYNNGNVIAIIPTGGSEQNGPHMVIGKHNTIVHYTAGEIAKRLGNALVAPVIAYVPEGSVEPPEGHMQFAGTLSVSEATYAALLTDAAASLKQNGFKLICFLGDSGGNQAVQKNLAESLTDKWKSSGVRVLQLSSYYDNNGQDAWVESKKIAVKDPGAHAGFEDTSELMAIDESAVRKNLLGDHSKDDFKITGTVADSRLASAEYGKYLLNLKIEAAVKQIQQYEK